MSEWNKVVWHEGMFLRQQHFQRQDRYVDWLFGAARMLADTPSFGFTALQLDQEALKEGQVYIENARGVFPDGTPFDIPETTIRPEPLGFSADSALGVVSLSIPKASGDSQLFDRPDHAPSGARYVAKFDDSARDVTAGSGPSERIEVAALSPRIDAPDAEVERRVSLALAEVRSVSTNGEIKLSEEFIPPALSMSATPYLVRFVKELINGFERAIEVHAKVVQGETSGHYDSLLKLELANSTLASLRHLRAQEHRHPADLYGYLAELTGRLATHEAADRKVRSLPDYVQAEPTAAFSVLADTMRPLLASLAHHTPRYQELETTRRGDNIWAVRVDNAEVLRNGSVILRIMANMSTDAIVDRFAEAIVAGAETFQTHWTHRTPGVGLKELRSHPRDIPYDGESVCLELDQTSAYWADASKPPGFALGVVGDLPEEPRLNCYVVYR